MKRAGFYVTRMNAPYYGSDSGDISEGFKSKDAAIAFAHEHVDNTPLGIYRVHSRGSRRDQVGVVHPDRTSTAQHKRNKGKLEHDINEALGRSKSRSANVRVYSRPSGYWYAQAHDAATGARITDASGHSRDGVLRELRGKFAMIGVAIKSVTDEDPYEGSRSRQ